MRRIFAAFMAVFIGFVFIGYTAAQTAPLRGPNVVESKTVPSLGIQPTPKAERKRLTGTVVAVDTASKTLVVKNWRGQTTFDAAGAKLARRASLEDIVPGDRIVVSYAEEDGRKTAKTLVATPVRFEEDNKTEVLKGTKLLKDESGKR